MAKIALFPGTFDPFTKGHANIVERALTLFDEIIIAVGKNIGKQPMFTLDKRVNNIEKIYKTDKRIKVMTYNGLTVDFAKSVNVGFIIRGVRTIHDFEYERELADVNKQISGIETIVLFTEPQYASISSSIVRELNNFGKDITEFLP